MGELRTRWDKSWLETGTYKNFMCESMYSLPYLRYKSWSEMKLHRYEAVPTQSGRSYPHCLISTHILHIVLSIIPHLSLSHTQLYDHCRTQSKVIPPYLSIAWSWVDTEYIIHRVQHSPSSTASTYDCSSSLHSHEYELTPGCQFSFQRPSLHDRPPSASSPWELKDEVALSHSHGCELSNWSIVSQHLTCRPPPTSKYMSNLAWSPPPSDSPNSLKYGLHVQLQTHPIPASKFAPSWPWSVSPHSFNHGHQVHPQTRSITASKCISRLAWSRPASSRNCGRQVHLQSRWINASECISVFTRSSCSVAPIIALKYILQPVEIYCV